MQNSLTLFLGVFSFILFGYLSLVRLMSKQDLGATTLDSIWRSLANRHFVRNVGSSALFLAFPATSLLLFWGWVPALLWLVIFHLIIESLAHLKLSHPENSQDVADYLLRHSSGWQSKLEQGIVQLFFLLCMAIVLALLATLIDRQSGLLFMLLVLLPARGLLRNSDLALPIAAKVVLAIVLLAFGLILSDQLGFSIYGDWKPFGEFLPWLRFDNSTIIALLLLIAVFEMERAAGFRSDLSLASGSIVLILFALMVFMLLMRQPSLDVGMHILSESQSHPPSFALIFLFTFTMFSALIIRLLNEEQNQIPRSKQTFSRLQGEGLLQLAFMLVLFLSLGAALGIGAWKTHYMNWPEQINILDHLNLAISSIMVLLGSEAESGAIMHTILLACLCITGLSVLLNCSDQLSLEEPETPKLSALIFSSKIPQAILIFVSCCYFIDQGVSLTIWVFVGILSWGIVCHLGLGICLNQQDTTWSQTAWKTLALFIILVGAIQVVVLGVGWLLSGEIIPATAAVLLLVLFVSLWFGDTIKVVKSLNQEKSASIL